MAISPAPYSDAEIPAMNGVIDKLPAQASKEVLSNGNHATVKPNHEKDGIQSLARDYAIPLHDQLAFTPRKLRVITVGAGFSGMMMAHKFQHRFPEMDAFIDHKIFEARHDIGGTWLVNTYPGVQCDVPSHIYVSLSR